MYKVIELGGGTNPLYHPNIDISVSAEVDIVCDITKGIPLPDGYADGIFSRDFIEHISLMDFLKLLKECRRVLRERGYIEFIVPDVNKTVITYDTWNTHLSNVLIGTDCGRPEMKHKMWWTPELMTYILEKEGWRNIQIDEYKKDIDSWKEPKFRVRAEK